MPATSGTVIVEVGDSTWMVPDEGGVSGQALTVQFAGTLLVTDVPDGTHVELLNPGYAGNAPGGTAIPAGAKVGVGGIEGPAGLLPGGALLAVNNLSDVSSVAGSRTSLGLGTMATQNANAVAITGGNISGITDLAVADGGTGSSTAAGARTNLGAAASGLATASGLTSSATDKVIGRSSAGAGALEEIACTATGRSLISQASVSAVQTLLGIGVIAVVTKTGGYLAALTDNLILVDATTGSIIIDLPAAATSTGHIFIVKKIDNTANTVTIRGHLAELIDGVNTQVISSQWTSITLVSNGTASYII